MFGLACFFLLSSSSDGGVTHDVGFPAVQGFTTTDGAGSFTIQGQGGDIWNGGDQFHFAYKKVTGNFDARMRISEIRDPVAGSRWGKTGLMARWTCDGNSSYSMSQIMLTTPGDVIELPRHSWRSGDNHLNNGGNRETFQVNDGILSDRRPAWQRMIRVGNTIYTYFSEDGEEWLNVGAESQQNRPDTILVGVAVTSHSGVEGQIDFDNFSIDPIDASTDLTCGPGENALIDPLDFEQPDGEAPAGAIVVDNDAANFTPSIVGGRLRVTEDGVNSQAHNVWYWTEENGLGDVAFVTEFDMFMASEDTAADGGSFAIIQAGGDPLAPFAPDLDLATLGGGGGGAQSYQGGAMEGRAEGHASFAVEFDNWQGGFFDNDPNGDNNGSNGRYHTGINVNASVNSVVSSGAVPDAFDETGVHVTVAYSPINDDLAKVDVYMHDNDGGPNTNPVSAVIYKLHGDLVLGFTGATGGANASLEFDNVELSDACSETRDTVSIEAGDGGGGAEVGDTVSFTATAGGVDDGGAAAYSWSVSGPGAIVGAADGASVSVELTDVGTVTVSVSSGDGVCFEYASALDDCRIRGAGWR